MPVSRQFRKLLLTHECMPGLLRRCCKWEQTKAGCPCCFGFLKIMPRLGLARSHLILWLGRAGAAAWSRDKSFALLPGNASESLDDSWGLGKESRSRNDCSNLKWTKSRSVWFTEVPMLLALRLRPIRLAYKSWYFVLPAIVIVVLPLYSGVIAENGGERMQ